MSDQETLRSIHNNKLFKMCNVLISFLSDSMYSYILTTVSLQKVDGSIEEFHRNALDYLLYSRFCVLKLLINDWETL